MSLNSRLDTLPTPDTSHVPIDRVYEPAEDSYLLCDTIAADARFLVDRFPSDYTPSPVLVEVCVGSGLVLAFCTAHAAELFGRTDLVTIGIDVNIHAIRAARETVTRACIENNRGKCSGLSGVFGGDLLSSLRDATVDILLCNPPYVPSEDLPEPPSGDATDPSTRFTLLALATDGGLDGMEVTSRLLDDLMVKLSPRGIAYVLLCARNKPDKVIGQIQKWGTGNEWNAEAVLKRSAGFERLQVIRIWRTLS